MSHGVEPELLSLRTNLNSSIEKKSDSLTTHLFEHLYRAPTVNELIVSH